MRERPRPEVLCTYYTYPNFHLFQITWSRQLTPLESADIEVSNSSLLTKDAAPPSPRFGLASAAGGYEILTIAEMTHISDDRFIIASSAVNNVSERASK